MVSLVILAGMGCVLVTKVRLKQWDVGCGWRAVVCLILMKLGREGVWFSINGDMDENE